MRFVINNIIYEKYQDYKANINRKLLIFIEIKFSKCLQYICTVHLPPDTLKYL